MIPENLREKGCRREGAGGQSLRVRDWGQAEGRPGREQEAAGVLKQMPREEGVQKERLVDWAPVPGMLRKRREEEVASWRAWGLRGEASAKQ